MKTKKSFIQLFLMAGLLFAVITSCKKDPDDLPNEETVDPGGAFPSAGTIKDADGNTYNTIKINNQVWTVENLKTTKYNDGTAIPNVKENSEWEKLTTGAYCNYDNDESKADTYGRLYNWYAVNTGKLAPVGWHVPTDAEWTIMENYLIANGYNYDFTIAENRIAKSLCAKTNWTSSTEVGAPGTAPENNNSSGFSALPGGIRFMSGKFDFIGTDCRWWSSTPNNTNGAYYRILYYKFIDLGRENLNGLRECGFSVRLVKD
jgi:uncharacterized protein (TIGR02145 family)